jgi:hypothetical protein
MGCVRARDFNQDGPMSLERWFAVEDGQLFLVQENDGWTYLRRGPERFRTPVHRIALKDTDDGFAVAVCYWLSPREMWSGKTTIPHAEAVLLRRFLADHAQYNAEK